MSDAGRQANGADGSSETARPAREPRTYASSDEGEATAGHRPMTDAANEPGTPDRAGGMIDTSSSPALPEPARYLNREISWLAFNGRVLQEAADPRVPLFDRLGFLAIFSSNLDEFFRVRVASLRSLLRLKKKKLKTLDFRPRRLLREIHFVVTSQQDTFANVFRSQILPEMETNGIFLLDDRTLTPEQQVYLRRYFRTRVRSLLMPQVLEDRAEAPFLREGRVYLVAELWPGPEVTIASERPSYGIVEVPAPPLPRFVVAPGGGHNVLFLEDVIRLSVADLFPRHEVGSAFAVKLSRDAELYLEDEFQGDLVDQIRKSLKKRETGLPSRFLYDLQAPYALISFMKEHLGLEDEDLVPGGRYPNLQDLLDFPAPGGNGRTLRRPALRPLAHPTLQDRPSVLSAVREADRLLHFPYQSFDYVVRFLEEAARDPEVDRIWITLYRVTDDSPAVRALIEAARRGIEVTAFVEVKARFDEARNLRWAGEMEEAGVRTVYSKPRIKIHAKMALVFRGRKADHGQGHAATPTGGTDKGACKYAYLSTGNFNERTAEIYADHGLLTADPRITEDVEQVFRHLWGEVEVPATQHVMVSPFTLRARVLELIRSEAERARAGGITGIVLKVNSLEDREVIDALYEASQAGTRIQLIVRGICRMRPGLEGLSENVKARSIVDRFLEHARIFRFVNDGRPLLYLSSADLMKRNLDHRVEVAFPVHDPGIREELEHCLHCQLADNTKARVLDPDQSNHYVGRRVGEPRVEAQEGFYHWLEDMLEGADPDPTGSLDEP